MSWVLVVDVGDGREALTFKSQREADEWEDAHPEVQDHVYGGMPTTSRLAVVRGARAREPEYMEAFPSN